MQYTQVTFRNMHKSDALVRLIGNQAEKLQRMWSQIIGVEVVVDAPNAHHHHNGPKFTVRLHVRVPGSDIFIGGETQKPVVYDDARVAVREAFRVARRRLDEHADFLRGEPGRHGPGIRTLPVTP